MGFRKGRAHEPPGTVPGRRTDAAFELQATAPAASPVAGFFAWLIIGLLAWCGLQMLRGSLVGGWAWLWLVPGGFFFLIFGVAVPGAWLLSRGKKVSPATAPSGNWFSARIVEASVPEQWVLSEGADCLLRVAPDRQWVTPPPLQAGLCVKVAPGADLGPVTRTGFESVIDVQPMFEGKPGHWVYRARLQGSRRLAALASGGQWIVRWEPQYGSDSQRYEMALPAPQAPTDPRWQPRVLRCLPTSQQQMTAMLKGREDELVLQAYAGSGEPWPGHDAFQADTVRCDFTLAEEQAVFTVTFAQLVEYAMSSGWAYWQLHSEPWRGAKMWQGPDNLGFGMLVYGPHDSVKTTLRSDDLKPVLQAYLLYTVPRARCLAGVPETLLAEVDA